MAGNSKYKLKKIISLSVWLILASGVVVLLVAAMKKKNVELINGIDIKISGVENNRFIDKSDVLQIIKLNPKTIKKEAVSSLDLTGMEKRLGKNQWIKKAELFFDNNKVLQVRITEREPIARVFTASGASFYIDSSLSRLPLSDKFSARLPVFTSFPSDAKVLKKQDSALLDEVKILSEYIITHPFWMAQIDQVDISSEGKFDLIPKLGNQVIHFGDASDYQQKFNKLLAFYKKVESNLGWNKYSVLDVQFKNQVIGVVRDAAEIKSDSLRAVEIMKAIIAEAEKNSSDSTKIQLPQLPDNNEKIIESPALENSTRESVNENINTAEKNQGSVAPIHHHEKPLLKNEFSKENKAVIRHPSSNEKPHPTLSKKKVERKQKGEEKRVPKAVMPPKSDY